MTPRVPITAAGVKRMSSSTSRERWPTRRSRCCTRSSRPRTPGSRTGWTPRSGRAAQTSTSPDRAVTLIRRGSTLIGLIEQDAAVTARPDAVELVATGAGLIMETEGLMAAARSDLEQSRQLASRLLSASDQPRAELRAQLLAGPLDELAMAENRSRCGHARWRR